MALTLYWSVYPDATADYANNSTDAAKLAAGQDSTGAALPAGSYGSQAYSAAGVIDASTAASGLTPGTAYRIAWTIGDAGVYGGGTSTYVVVSGAISTLPQAVAAIAGASGAFSGTASSPATATLAATGASGALSATSSSPATAGLSAAGDSGTLSASANSGTSAELSAAGGSGDLSAVASVPATVSLAATGASGVLDAAASLLQTLIQIDGGDGVPRYRRNADARRKVVEDAIKAALDPLIPEQVEVQVSFVDVSSVKVSVGSQQVDIAVPDTTVGEIQSTVAEVVRIVCNFTRRKQQQKLLLLS